MQKKRRESNNPRLGTDIVTGSSLRENVRPNCVCFHRVPLGRWYKEQLDCGAFTSSEARY